MKRVAVDVLVGASLLVVFLSGAHMMFPPPVDLVALKGLLVSLGFVHAHVMGKLAFPRVEWRNAEFSPNKILRILLYVVVIYAYATGG